MGGLIGSQTLVLTGSASVADKNVGTNKPVILSSLSLNDGSNGGLATNYTLVGSNPVVTIASAPLTLTPSSDSKAYDGTTSSTGLVSISGLFSPDSVSSLSQSFVSKNVLGSNLSTLQVNSGYSINDGNGGHNYSVSLATANGSITPKLLMISGIDAVATTYGTAAAPGNVSLAGLISGDQVFAPAALVNSSSSTSGHLRAGSYAQTASVITGSDALNYSLAAPFTTSTSNYVVSPLALTGAAVAPSSSVYGSALTPGLVSFSNTVGTDLVGSTASVNTSVLSTGGNPIVGSYTQSASGVSGLDAANYSFSGFTTTTPNYSITPLALAISGAIAANKAYDGSTTASVNGASITALGSDQVSLSGADAVFSDKNVGTNKSVFTAFTIAGADAANYSLLQAPTLSGSITPGALSVALNPQSKTYDGTNTALLSPADFSLTGFISGDGATVNQSAGTYNSANVIGATAVSTTLNGSNFTANTGTLLSNYNLPTTASGAGTITQRTLSSWTGAAGNQLWSDPRNWDALPSLANVRSVDIPAGGGAVIYDASAGSTTLSALSTADALQISGGTLIANGGLTLNALTISGGQLSGSGSLRVNGLYSQSAGLLSGFSIIDLRQNNSSPLAITGGSLLSPAAQISIANLSGPLTIDNAILDASGGLDGGRVDLNGSAIAIANSNISTSGSNDGGSIQLGMGSPLLQGLQAPLPSSVSITNAQLVADPPTLGGVIGIDGRSISIAGTLLNVFGGSGGSIALGSTNTTLLSLDPATLITTGSQASLGFQVGPGGILTNSANGGLYSTPTPPLTTSPLPVEQIIIQSYITQEAILTQSPFTSQQMDTQQTEASGVSFVSALTMSAMAPQLTPAVNLSLEQSNFLFAGELNSQTIDQTATTPLATPDSAVPDQLSGSTTASQQPLSADPQSDAQTEGQTDDKINNQNNHNNNNNNNNQVAPPPKTPLAASTNTTTTFSTVSSPTPSPTNPLEQQQNQILNSAAVLQSTASSPTSAATAAAANLTEPQAAARQGSTAAIAGRAQDTRANVSTISPAQASKTFSDSEARAQTDTANKLGLNNTGAAPPTPSQIQGLLQKVIQSLRAQPQSSR